MPRSRITLTPNDWSPAGQKVEEILMAQGRQTDWLADQLGISRNYLYRMRLNTSNPMYRQPQPGLWARIEHILGEPAGTIEPRQRGVARDRSLAEERLRRAPRRDRERVAATA
jgi:hypothetical protein